MNVIKRNISICMINIKVGSIQAFLFRNKTFLFRHKFKIKILTLDLKMKSHQLV